MIWGCARRYSPRSTLPLCEMHRAAKLDRTSLNSDEFQRHPQTLSSPPPPRSGFRRDERLRRCLARSLTSLALMRTPKSENGPRSNSFRPDSPSTTTSHGDGTLRQPPHHTGHGPFRTRPSTSVKSPISPQSPKPGGYFSS